MTNSGTDASHVLFVNTLSEEFLPLTSEASSASIPVTLVSLKHSTYSPDISVPENLTFHFAMVDGGKVTTVPSLDITWKDLTNGVTLEGRVEPPVSARQDGTAKVLDQAFLLKDANDAGVYVTGEHALR